MTVYFIRHGMTEANEKRLYCGATDLPLSDRGRDELHRLRITTAYPPAYLYITSGLRRANETLGILYGREPDLIISELCEYDFGEFEMKGYEELKDEPLYRQWISGGHEERCPGGESRSMFNRRIELGLRRLDEVGVESVAVICHGGVIATIMDKLYPAQKNFYQWQPQYGGGYVIENHRYTALGKA